MSRKVLLPLVLCLSLTTLPQVSRAQSDSALAPVKSEIQIEGGRSVGNYHLFADATSRAILPIGIEYDRHSWGGVFGAEVDYVGEILPVYLLSEPAKYGVNGHAQTTARQWQYGASLSPIGVRMIWRRPGQVQPYLISKGGVLYFKNRVLSTQDTHLQFNAEFGGGGEVIFTRRLGFRIGFSEYHFSNGNISRHNPGLDAMYINGALTIRLGNR